MSGTKVVVIGNGIAGAALVDSLIDEAPDGFSITLYGDEHVGTYDRVRLSEYMAGSVGLEELGCGRETGIPNAASTSGSA